MVLPVNAPTSATTRRRIVLALLLAAGCGGATPRATTGAGDDPEDVEALRVPAPQPAADRYDDAPEGDGLLAEQGAEAWTPSGRDVRRSLEEGLGGTAGALRGDDRLARLAAAASEHVPAGSTAPPSLVVDFLARGLGLTDTPLAVAVAAIAPGGDPLPALADMGARLRNRVRTPTHFGLASMERDGLRLLALALGRRAVDVAPFPRHVPASGQLTFSARLGGAHTEPRLLVDGARVRIGASSARRLRAEVTFQERGTHRLRLEAKGPDGPETLLDVPIHVGEPPPTELVLRIGTEETVDPEAARRALREGIAALRRDQGLDELQPDELLDELARRQAQELVRLGTLSHRDARGGLPEDRLRAARYPFRRVLENVGAAPDVERLLAAWQASPSHRANLLDGQVTRLGVGLAPRPAAEGGGLVAVALLVRPVERIDTAAAPSRLLRSVNEARRRRRARPLRVDEKLAQAAAAAAKRYFEEPEATERQIVEDASASLRRFAIAFGRVGGVMVVVGELDEAGRLEPLFDPSARYVGVGVAQGQRPGGPPNQIAVVYLLGWPR